MKSHKLGVLSLGLALGVAWGIGVLLIGLGGMMWGLWPNTTTMIAEWYIGFSPTVLGSLIGSVWGFVDGLIGGVVVAWLYNRFQP